MSRLYVASLLTVPLLVQGAFWDTHGNATEFKVCIDVVVDDIVPENVLNVCCSAGEDPMQRLTAQLAGHPRGSLIRESDVEFVRSNFIQRAHRASRTLRRAHVLLLADARHEKKLLDAALTAISTERHAVLHLVLHGIDLGKDLLRGIIEVMERAEWHGLYIHNVPEKLPIAVGINEALDKVRDNAVVAILWNATLQEPGLFLAFEKEIEKYGHARPLAVVGRLGHGRVLTFESAALGFLRKWHLGYRGVGALMDVLHRAEKGSFLAKDLMFAQTFAQEQALLHQTGEQVQRDVDIFFALRHRCSELEVQSLCFKKNGAVSKTEAFNNLEFYWTLAGVQPSQDLLHEWRSTIKPLPVICVYDDIFFIEEILSSMIAVFDNAVVLVSRKPWRGPRRHLSSTFDALGQLLRVEELNGMIQILAGDWETEEDQRNFGNNIVSNVPGNFTHAFVVDADEFWDPVDLERTLGTLATKSPATLLRFSMKTYWKSPAYVVDPPEDLRALVLVDPRRCSFVKNREVQCVAFEPLTTFEVEPDLAVCHHFSYVRTDADLVQKKLPSFSHSHELVEDWLAAKWFAWDNDHSIEDLHPVDPSAYKRTICQDLSELPMGIRAQVFQYHWECFINNADSQAHKLMCRSCQSYEYERFVELEAKVDVEAFLNSVKPFDDKEVEALPELSWVLPNDEEGYLTPEGAYRNSIDIGDVREESLQYLSISKNETNTFSSKEATIVTVGCGELDRSTRGTFLEIAEALGDTFRYLGYRTNVEWCMDMRFCRHNGSAIVVLLGVHNLARYTEDDGELSILVRDWIDGNRTILYNFEDVRGQDDFQSGDMWTLLRGFSGRVWDYHLSNVNMLRHRGVNALHVPIGFSEAFHIPSASRPLGKGFDVLFVGRLNDYRRRVLEGLRDLGVQVYHANAVEPIYGKELQEHVVSTKIVLSLRYYEDDAEWKATRLMLPLSNRVLVVSEVSGHPEDIDYFSQGVVFRNTIPELADAIHYYLKHDTDRERVAKIGYELFKKRPMHVYIREGLAGAELVYEANNAWRIPKDDPASS